jgi:ubiquinone/menaquinone biosynthesis C-methylase UbiE
MSIDDKAEKTKAEAYAGPNAEQSRNWNELSGKSWVAETERIGAQLRPLGERALARADLGPGLRVLDVGCGGGATTIALSKAVGPTGSVLGLDISQTLLDHARENAAQAGVANVSFELADAQTAALPEAAFDRLFSRFGVMFFEDPVAAFTNLRRSLKPGARLAFVCWRGMDDNPWMKVTIAAVSKHVTVQRAEPNAPGPMAFADGERTRGILERAGFAEVALEEVNELMDMGGGLSDLDETVAFMTKIGPAASALRGAEPEVLAAAVASIREALLPYQGAEGVKMPASCWVVTAVNR